MGGFAVRPVSIWIFAPVWQATKRGGEAKGALPFLSARKKEAHKNARSFDFAAAPTSTSRGHEEGGSKRELHPFERNPTDSRGRVFSLPAATSPSAWRRSSAGGALPSSGQGRPFGYTRSGPGWNWGLQRCVWLDPQKVLSLMEAGRGAADLRAQCCSSTVPASRRTPNASRVRRRRAGSRQRMECGGLPPLCVEPEWSPAFPRDVITTG